MDKNILKYGSCMTQTIKRQTKADVSNTACYGYPCLYQIISTNHYKKPHQNRTKTHPHKRTQKVKTKKQQPKTNNQKLEGKTVHSVMSQTIKSLQFLVVKTQRKTTMPLSQAHLQENRTIILGKGNSQVFFPSSH